MFIVIVIVIAIVDDKDLRFIQLEQFLKEITQDEGENNQLQQIEVETQVPKDQSIPDIINENIKNSTQEKPKSYY